jgi:hypothetical protein
VRPRVAGPAGTLVAYSGAFVAYVVLGLVTRNWVLNWVVGPLFPVLVLYVAPHAVATIWRPVEHPG